MLVVKDICLFKLQRYYQQIKSNNSNFLVINFRNKLVENVNLRKILNDVDVSSSFPHTNVNMKMPSISYSYTKTNRSEIVNYKETVNNIDIQHNVKCPCSKYDNNIINNAHGHIFTGGLTIVKDIKLQQLLQKGLNYRDQQPPDGTKAYTSIQVGIDTYVSSICKKTNIPSNHFSEWRNKILTLVKERET